jgi:hypothetical protein
MKLVQSADLPFVERVNPRGGVFHHKPLLEGVPGRKDNFLLTLSRTFEDFVSPRHRHNFDQIRYQIAGTGGFGRDGGMTPGSLAYFPEGTHYGPQSAAGEMIVLVLQVGGASGSGYMSEAELQQSVAQLKREGEFSDGIYRRRGGGRPQDAYEAAWEHRHGRPLVYPPPRYQAPVLLYPEAFAWMAHAPGVAIRHLGQFGDRGPRLAMIRIEAGAAGDAAGPAILFVLDGGGWLDGQVLKAGSALHLSGDDRRRITATSQLGFLRIGLPRFDDDIEPAERAAA